MARLFAITLLLIALGSALFFMAHPWMPRDISATGSAIDRQMSSTILEAGGAFLLAQILLAVFIWKFSARRSDEKISKFPGGATGLVLAAIFLVGTEVVALSVFGQKSWARMFLEPASPDALTVQVQAEQFAYYFRYPGPDGKFGTIHPEKIDESAQNFFGLDREHDAAAKDDIVSAVMAIPVNREINLLMRSKDVGHSFYVPELRLQQDFVPGMDLSLHFTATQLGRYEIICTQLCGLGHYKMRAYLDVMSAEDFEQWLKKKAATQATH
jgi:cytochrome c oxidase subunit II